MRPKPIAIACSDLHLSLRPPLARAGEEDWLEAMDIPLGYIRELQETLDVPVLIAGDIFDRWFSSPRLINWAISHFPKKVFAIPGQHDLPNHRLDLISDSAYWTLVEAGVISDLSGDKDAHVVNSKGGILLSGYPWGVPLVSPTRHHIATTYVALVHAYTWIKGCEYPGAPKEAKLTNMKGLEGWDVIIIGDNHKGFHVYNAEQTIFNCGTLMRRKSDEIDYKPQVGVIMSDGTIEVHYLDCSDDIIQETSTPKANEDMELKDFLEELVKLQDTGLDFESAIERALEEKKPNAAVRQMILEAMS